MKIKTLLPLLGVAASLCAPAQKPGRVTVDFSRRGAEIPTSLYGIFFEEISHAGDGGLYAEMIVNRGFEDGNAPSGTVISGGYARAPLSPCYSNDSINRFTVDVRRLDAMNGWSVEYSDGGRGRPEWAVVTDLPLNPGTPHSLRLGLNGSPSEVNVTNGGYWGIAVEEGRKYDLEFHMRSEGYAGRQVTVSLTDRRGRRIAQRKLAAEADGPWHRYTATFDAPCTADGLRLTITFEPTGVVWLDYVSLFPQHTFMNRRNGLREDVSRLLADMKPAFMRWPGGCIVEGLTMENRVKWKETVGDPVRRPGEYNLWGYRSTYGLGYHEFLQFCEDIGCDGMFVCNAGMSCLFRNGDFYDAAGVDSLIREALDAIEYAIGPADSYWGKARARNGHEKPFPLKYIEVGNENIGSRYAANYNRFHKAIKERYPQITVITALMFSKNLDELDRVEVIDPHYYELAEWFYNNADVYDKLPAKLPYKVYVGEYAATGEPSIYSSLAEAAFMTGVERNGDKVCMVSYAPLLQNANHGRGHLIVLDNLSAYGRTNYYVMKMFAENRPDVNLLADIDEEGLKVPVAPSGFVGLATVNTVSQFRDFRVSKGGKTLYSTSWDDLDTRWKAEGGSWSAAGGILTQAAGGGDAMLRLDGFAAGDCDIQFKARKVSGSEGFRAVFGGRDARNYYMADMGSHTNESVIFRQMCDHGSVSLFDYRNQEPVLTGHWYDVRVEIRGNNWKCYMDGKLKYEYNHYAIRKHYAVAGYDKARREIVVKLVNGENAPWHTSLDLRHTGPLAAAGSRIELSAPSPRSENSFADPEKFSPATTVLEGVMPGMAVTAAPNSFTILRIPLK